MIHEFGLTKDMIEMISAAKGRKLKAIDAYKQHHGMIDSVLSLRFPGFSLELSNYLRDETMADEMEKIVGEPFTQFQLKYVKGETKISPVLQFTKPKKIPVEKKIRNVRLIRDNIIVNDGDEVMQFDKMIVFDFDDSSITICRFDYEMELMIMENNTNFEKIFPMIDSKNEWACLTKYIPDWQCVGIKREITEI